MISRGSCGAAGANALSLDAKPYHLRRLIAGKKKSAFVLKLEDRHCSGLSEARLDRALDTLVRFALTGVMQKLDPRGRIPIEDCSLSISTKDKAATLIISIDAKREKELASAVQAVYKDLLSQIDRFGIDQLIAAGRRAYG